jgi:hypothetical protein
MTLFSKYLSLKTGLIATIIFSRKRVTTTEVVVQFIGNATHSLPLLVTGLQNGSFRNASGLDVLSFDLCNASESCVDSVLSTGNSSLDCYATTCQLCTRSASCVWCQDYCLPVGGLFSGRCFFNSYLMQCSVPSYVYFLVALALIVLFIVVVCICACCMKGKRGTVDLRDESQMNLLQKETGTEES